MFKGLSDELKAKLKEEVGVVRTFLAAHPYSYTLLVAFGAGWIGHGLAKGILGVIL